MGSHQYFQDLIPMDVLGSLSAAEQKELREHLAGCAECRKMYQAHQAIAQMLPRSVESVQPSRETKQKLFARVDADLAHAAPRLQVARPVPKETEKDKPRRSWFAQPVFAFALIAVLALLAVAFWLLPQVTRSPDQVAIDEIMNHPNVQRVALQGTPDAPGASGEMYMVPGQSQAVLRVNGLNPLPSDKGYEFWFFRGGDPQPSDVFIVNPDGTNTVLVRANDTVENFKGWGVTIEPKAGVPKPTGPIVILGGL